MAAIAHPVGGSSPSRSQWARRYPPLLALFVALLIAVAVLPSSLNLPQTNPTQTLEYAPVPPDDENPDVPPNGNFDSLGLGSTSGIAGEGLGGDNGGTSTTTTLPPGAPGGPTGSLGNEFTIKNPSVYRCVGDPPRQTEDPLSPPCVGYFKGDNFGKTYEGVTREEIRLLIYIDGFVAETGGSAGREERPTNKYFDLFKAPKEGETEHLIVRAMRVWQAYFNSRFQTYGRKVHFWLYFHGQDREPENRRADAADNYLHVKPFAVLTDTSGNEDAYLKQMASKGVLNFGSFANRERSFFEDFPKMIWGYQPMADHLADLYTSYVCKKVAPYRSVLNGDTDTTPGPDAGKPRKYGLIHTSDPGWPGYIRLAENVKQRVRACGAEVIGEGTFDYCCFFQDNSSTPDYASEQMAEFKQKGITTILWTGGLEGYYGEAAQQLGYEPEWIILGDTVLDANNPIRLAGHSTAFDGHAIAISPQVFEPALRQQRCYQAFREVDPNGNAVVDADMGFICDYYTNLFQMFTGIQVAGPRLGPTSIDTGFHAIPERRSSSPQVPACFYTWEGRPDYTCVKDAQQEIWDAQGAAPGDSRPGCWKSIEGGLRYLPEEWPGGNINAQITGREPCNGYSNGALLNPNATR